MLISHPKESLRFHWSYFIFSFVLCLFKIICVIPLPKIGMNYNVLFFVSSYVAWLYMCHQHASLSTCCPMLPQSCLHALIGTHPPSTPLLISCLISLINERATHSILTTSVALSITICVHLHRPHEVYHWALPTLSSHPNKKGCRCITLLCRNITAHGPFHSYIISPPLTTSLTTCW